MDLSPIVNAAVQLAAIVIIAVGTWAIQRAVAYAQAYFRVKVNSAIVQGFDDALARAVHAAAGQAEDLVKAKGWDHPDVKNTIVRLAVEYALNKSIPALKMIGLDPADPGGATTRYLTDELNRIFPTAIAPVAASPVTPPAQVEGKV